VEVNSLPYAFFFHFTATQQRRQRQNCDHILFFCLVATHQKKAMTITLSLPSFFVFWLEHNKKGDDNNIVNTFFFWL
jgi:hypothetical protein